MRLFSLRKLFCDFFISLLIPQATTRADPEIEVGGGGHTRRVGVGAACTVHSAQLSVCV